MKEEPNQPLQRNASTGPFRFQFSKMIRILLCFFLSVPLIAAGSADADWKPVKNAAFSFSLPQSFKKTDARGIDSFVEEYIAEGIKLNFDYGSYSNDFSDWPKDTKFERLTIHGKEARIGAVKNDYHKGYPYSTQIYIKLDEHTALSMFAACRSEPEVSLARRIFLTIVFEAKKA
ncbi:MAG: hypothetical protein QM760_11440 [Nibricoccus sp.]